MKQDPPLPTVPEVVQSPPPPPPRVQRSTTSTNRVYINKRPIPVVQKDDSEWQVDTPKRKPITKIEIKKEEPR